jgi:hypothetical protein
MNDLLILNRIGNTSDLEKGSVDGKMLFAWDSIQNCTGKKCIIVDRCEHLKKGKCALQLSYIMALSKSIFSKYRFMDEVSLFKVGMHLVPLYSQLCRLKMLELSIENLEVVDSKGRISIHPVHKQIRETIMVIIATWRDLDINYKVGSGIDEEYYPKGDLTHYDRMVGTSVQKEGLTR